MIRSMLLGAVAVIAVSASASASTLLPTPPFPTGLFVKPLDLSEEALQPPPPARSAGVKPIAPVVASDGQLLTRLVLASKKYTCIQQDMEIQIHARVKRSAFCDDPSFEQNAIDDIQKAGKRLSQQSRNCLYRNGYLHVGIMEECGVPEDLAPLAESYVLALESILK